MKIKNILAALLLMVAGMQTTWAQHSIKVWRNGGFELFKVSEVDSISFVNLVTDISLSQKTLEMNIGETKQLTANALPLDADERTVTWKSSNEDIAAVDQTGMVTAKTGGTCSIIAKATDGSGVTAECQVTVVQLVTGIILNLDSLSLTTGETATLEATVEPSNASNLAVEWKSNDTKIATVDQEGKVTAVAPGTCTITCSAKDDSGVTAECQVMVIQLVTGITLNQDSLSLTTGGTAILEATVEPSNASNLAVEWKSNDTKVASVDQEGKVTAIAPGTCKITCSSKDGSGVTAECQVTVIQLVTGITLDKNSLSLTTGETAVLKATVEPSNASNLAVEWKSSEESVAKVSEEGQVTAIAPGTCSISCSSTDGSGIYAECQVTVKDVDNPIIDNPLDGHEWVDLGLPSGTLWATCNVGANKSEEDGNYYAWGETEFESKWDDDEEWYYYSWDNYKYGRGSSWSGLTMTKYNADDSKTELDSEDDAATVNWSSNWKMPSAAQLEELINENNTTTIWTKQNGKYGYLITSKNNGNNIFLPAAGYSYLGQITYSTTLYLSRTLNTSNYEMAKAFEIYNYNNVQKVEMTANYRYVGMSVRPVAKDKMSSLHGPVQQIILSETSLTLNDVGETAILTATVFPENAINKELTWESSNEDIAIVDQTGKVEAVAFGSCTITCSAKDGSGVTAECQVTVSKITNPLDGHEWVDLGLPSGTLWATCNIGANSPVEGGDYFAWGETKTKNNYTEDAYTYVLPSGQTELEASADAATVNWGSNWQMPSAEQMDELINELYTSVEQVYDEDDKFIGYQITSKINGKSILLPNADFKYGTTIYYSKSGYYWSRTAGSDNYGYCLWWGGVTPRTQGNTMIRSYGATIRPVTQMPSGLVRQIVLSETSFTLNVDDTKVLKATVLPENADNKEVTWESSNDDVAEVNEGRVTAISVGSCTITCSATDGSGVKTECQVTVIDNGGGNIIYPNPLDGQEWVDLGLPSGTLWAKCNVGASKPEEYGGYYAWGETEYESKYDEDEDEYYYSWGNYKYCRGSESNMTKYNVGDGKTELDPEDDAATVNWSSNWQMPSAAQCQELIDTTYNTLTMTTQNGKKGYVITSKSNGNSIFLPAAGLCNNYEYSYSAGRTGTYLSRTLYTSNVERAEIIDFYSISGTQRIEISANYRYCGMSVRPVVKGATSSTIEPEQEPGLVSQILLSETSITLNVDEKKALTATVLPEDADSLSVTWGSTNPWVAMVDNNGLVTAKGNGICFIGCNATDGSGVSAYCRVTVKDSISTPDNHEWVDLGLPSGTLWATCNVGASKPEEPGIHFAWGETEPKSEYSWDTYKYYDTSYKTVTKYCMDSKSGSIDNKTELEPEDDAATTNWGSNWQMPSLEQLKELMNTKYTTRSWTTMNGVKGRMFVSKINGNRIFLPVAGHRSGKKILNAGNGYYWSRILNENSSKYARRLSFNSKDIATGIYLRYYGRTVRPVRKQ